jgi:hypothetical protein
MTDMSVVVSNDEVRVAGGSLHGQTIEIEFAENVVHVLEDEHYVCKTIHGERALIFVSEPVFDYFLSTASFVTI